MKGENLKKAQAERLSAPFCLSIAKFANRKMWIKVLIEMAGEKKRSQTVPEISYYSKQ